MFVAVSNTTSDFVILEELDDNECYDIAIDKHSLEIVFIHKQIVNYLFLPLTNYCHRRRLQTLDDGKMTAKQEKPI